MRRGKHEPADYEARGRLADPARGADRWDDVLADLGLRRPRGETGQRDPAGGAVPDQARADPRRRRNDPGDECPAQGRRADALLPPLPDRAPIREPRRLLDPGPVAGGPRAVRERIPDLVEREPQHDLHQNLDKVKGVTITRDQ